MRTIPTSLVKQKLYCVNYIVYKDESDNQGFLYLATRQDKMPDLQEAIKRGNFEAEDYGIILEHGKGESPPEVQQKMQILYNCDHSSNLSVLDYTPEEEES